MNPEKLAELAERGEPTGMIRILECGPLTVKRMDDGTLLGTAAIISSEPIYRSSPLLREIAASLRSLSGKRSSTDGEGAR